MGLESVFSAETSDLSGMVEPGGEPLFVDQVIHEAFISVDEQGTEAAAATAMGLGGGGPPDRYTVRLDRPFLFFIYDQRTDTLLFMGRVMNPAE
jgi:serpin B